VSTSPYPYPTIAMPTSDGTPFRFEQRIAVNIKIPQSGAGLGTKPSRNLHREQDPFGDLFNCRALGLGLVGENQTMAQN